MRATGFEPALRYCAIGLAVFGAFARATPATAQLALAVQANAGVAVPGEQLEIQITVSNRDATNANAGFLNLVIPSGVDPFHTAVATGSQGAVGCDQIVNDAICQAGETLAWNLGVVIAGQSETVSVAATVSAGASGTISFDATLTVGGAASATVLVNAARELELSLHEARDPVAAGDEITYTLHYGNASLTDTVPDAVLVFLVPAGTSYVSASDSGDLDGDTVEWLLGTLLPGQSGTRAVTVAAGAGLVRGTLVFAEAELAGAAQLALARAVTEIDGVGPIAIAMALGPDPVRAGEQLEIQLTLTNTSASATLGIPTVQLRWPQEVAPFNPALATANGGSCSQIANDSLCQGGEHLGWTNLGGTTLDPGQSVTVSVALNLGATPDGTVVDFEAFANSGNDNRAAVGRALTVNSSRRLELSLHQAREPVAPGGEIEYTLHYGNPSPTVAAPNALLAFPVPAGTTFVSASGGVVPNGDTVEWPLGTLEPGQSGTQTVVVQANVGAMRGASVLAEAELSDSSLPPQLARANAVTEIDGLEALEIGMALGPDPIGVGEQLELVFTVTNTGASQVSGTGLVLRLPQEIDPFSTARATVGPALFACDQIVNDALCQAGELFRWNLTTLEAGQSKTIALAFDLAATPDGSVVDFEAIASSGGDDRAAVGRALSVDSPRQLQLGLHGDRDPVTAGDDLVYTLYFGNTSQIDTGPNAMLTFQVPDGTTYVSSSQVGEPNGDTVEWSLGTLLPGQSGTRIVTVATGGGLARGALVLAEAELSDASLPPQHARANAVSEIDGLEPLETEVQLTDDPGPGTRVDLTVANTDTVLHGLVALALQLPQPIEPFSLASVSGSPGGCGQIVNDAFCQGGEFISWNLGNLAAGQSLTRTLPALVVTGAAGGVFGLNAIAADNDPDDRAADRVFLLPEPGLVEGTGAAIVLLAALSRRRLR